jgi:hypothetical protein
MTQRLLSTSLFLYPAESSSRRCSLAYSYPGPPERA